MEKIKDGGRILLKSLRFFRPYLKWLLLGQVTLILSVGLRMIFPWVIKEIFDTMIRAGDLHQLGYLVVGLIVVFALQAFVSFIKSYSLSIVGHNVAKDMRVATYSKIQDLSMGFFERNRLGDLVSRIINDIGVLQGTLTGGVTALLQQLFLLISGTFLLFSLDAQLTMVTMIVVPLVVFLSKLLGDRIRSISREVQRRLGEVTTFLEETLGGISTIKAFRLEEHVRREFTVENSRILQVALGGDKYRAGIGSIIGFLNDIALVTVMGYGGYRVIRGAISPGELIAFILYVETITGPISGLIGVYAEAQRALGAAERVFELMEAPVEVSESPARREVLELKGEVEFRGVSFAYEAGKEVLKDINFRIRPGEMVALVGLSGAGKSTIAKLIPRFYDVTEGAILIDGHNVKEIPLEQLREMIGIVPQEPYLFGISIRDNIACGKVDATDEEIIEAAKAANAHEFIMGLKDGYRTEVGERGLRLSGGQKQRIAIARAILKNPRILILDEATSSLDTISERAIQDALTHLSRTRSTLIIAHRLSTVKNADRILLLDQGRIAEAGTHDELMRAGGMYARLYGTGYFTQGEGVIEGEVQERASSA